MLIVNILVNNKVNDLKFYYVVVNNIIDIPINFLMNWCIFGKSYAQTHLIFVKMGWYLVYGLRMIRSTFLLNLKKI